MSRLISPLAPLTLQEDHLLPSPRLFKQSVREFLLSDGSRTTREKKRQLEFIPYVQERDSIGNLLPKKTRSTSVASSSKPATPRVRPNPDIVLNDLIAGEPNFESFICSPRISRTPLRVPPRILCKPLDLKKKIKPSPSRCFLTTARKEPRGDETPGVGQYTIMDKIIHPSPKRVVFTRERKIKSISSNYQSARADEDILKSFDKIRSKKISVPDFGKNTARENHHSYMTLKQPEIIHQSPPKRLHYQDIIARNIVVAREHPKDFEFKRKDNYFSSPRTIPLDSDDLNEKFEQAKYEIIKIESKVHRKKYNIYY